MMGNLYHTSFFKYFLPKNLVWCTLEIQQHKCVKPLVNTTLKNKTREYRNLLRICEESFPYFAYCRTAKRTSENVRCVVISERVRVNDMDWAQKGERHTSKNRVTELTFRKPNIFAMHAFERVRKKRARAITRIYRTFTRIF